MAARGGLRKEQEPPQKRRRSLRLENKKNLPFDYKRFLAYQGPTTSEITQYATPRTLIKKLLQTLPVTSPLVPVKSDTSKPAEPVVQLPSEHIPCSDIEISLSESAPKKKCQTSLLKTKSKKISLSEFEKGLNKQFDSNTVQSSLENTSLTKSLQISFKTPAPLPIVGKKGLIRRPKKYRGINVKGFEEEIEQNLLRVQKSQSYLQALQAATSLSSNAELTAADTELFAEPLPSGQNGDNGSNAPSRHTAARQSSTRGSMLPSRQTLSPAREKSRADFGMPECGQKEVLGSETGFDDEPESVAEENADGPPEEQPKKLQGTVKELVCTRNAGEMEAIPQGRPCTSGNVEQEDLPRNSCEAQLSLSEEYLTTEIRPVRTSTPIGARLPEVYPGHLSSLPREKSAKRSVKEMVSQIIEELDRSVIPAVSSQGISEANLREEPNEKAATPGRGVSRKNPDQLERAPRKKTAEEITPQVADGGKTSEVLDMISEAEMDTESKEMSEAGTDLENAEPTGKTPAFVHVRAFQRTSLLSTLQAQKMAESRSPYTQPSVKQAPKPAKRGQSSKCEPALPSSFVKKLFKHYVRMPVNKDAFRAVETCVNLYFRNMSNDLEAYTNHARRKTIEPADLELLMRRQRLITDKMPLNVLIERHLPLEYRKLLIPVASAGNKVVPPKPL
uniref:Centromere protein T n=1 Tax=Pogona vitticeps TaxID=103695 RepID=A0ABM5EV62_9SAUR